MGGTDAMGGEELAKLCRRFHGRLSLFEDIGMLVDVSGLL